MEHGFSFERLNVWKKARELVIKIYACTKKFPTEERFGLTSQLQRAAVSVASNLAEGTSRSSFKEKLRFTEIAYGSLMETYCQLMIAKDLNYIVTEDLDNVLPLINEIAKMLNALRSTQQNSIS